MRSILWLRHSQEIDDISGSSRRALLAQSSPQDHIQTPTIGAGSRRRRSESWKGVSYASRVSRFQCSTSRWNEPAIAVPYRVNHRARARQVAGWPFLEPMDRTGCQRVDLSGHTTTVRRLPRDHGAYTPLGSATSRSPAGEVRGDAR